MKILSFIDELLVQQIPLNEPTSGSAESELIKRKTYYPRFKEKIDCGKILFQKQTGFIKRGLLYYPTTFIY